VTDKTTKLVNWRDILQRSNL